MAARVDGGAGLGYFSHMLLDDVQLRFCDQWSQVDQGSQGLCPWMTCSKYGKIDS